jgi:hypothetical protein
MGWQERLRPFITLISPTGQEFKARWRGDDISISKRIQRVSHPDIDGESTADLGLNSPDYPLTIYFEGKDHDTEALRFSRAIAERGLWSVTHPVYGLLRLQPVKITIRAQPVESGNITEVSGEWFEPVSDTGAISPAAPDPAAAVRAAVSYLSDAAKADAAKITKKAASNFAAKRSAAEQFKKGLRAMKSLDHFNDRITAIMETINDLAMRDYLDTASLSGSVIQLLESPGLFLGNTASRLSMFFKLNRSIITGLLDAGSFSYGQIAAAITGELWLNAIAIGMGIAITQDLPETRPEALSILAKYRDSAAASRDALGVLAKATAGNAIEEQYFPRATSAEAVLTLNAAVARYIMGVAFDLKTEKRIVLERPTNPMLLAIREYGAGAANADAAFDLLCRTNNLHGRELLLLDRMREIVIYA